MPVRRLPALPIRSTDNSNHAGYLDSYGVSMPRRVVEVGRAMKAKMMKKALVIPMSAAAAIFMTSVSALALDRVQGTVQRVDTTVNEFTIAVDGSKKQRMTFKVSASKFEELALDVNDRLVVEYDKAECAGKADCVAKASEVDHKR